MSSGDHYQQQQDNQQRPRLWWVKGLSGSRIHTMPAQPTESVATRIGWAGTSRRVSDATCRTIHFIGHLI